MNGRLRLLLCAACLVIGAFQAPLSMHVFAQDLSGPYEPALARHRGAVAASIPVDAVASLHQVTASARDSRTLDRSSSRGGSHAADSGAAHTRHPTLRR